MIKQAKMDLGIPYQELKIQDWLGIVSRIFSIHVICTQPILKELPTGSGSNEEPTDLGELNKGGCI
jgi:hypothetical protein